MQNLKENIRWCTVRLLTMHAKAQVGHLGGNLSCLTGLCAIYSCMGERDRFILSKGHSAGALYVALANKGVISEDELKSFHQDGTRLPGHPPANIFKEIPFATGSLGHGLSLASGFALSQKIRGENANTFCLTSDGEWQEGSTWEALIFACHHGLKNLTILVDHNGLQGFGHTAGVASMDPLWEKLSNYDIESTVLDGHDPDLIVKELNRQQEKVRIIFLQTTKGKGIQGIEGEMCSHYLPLSNEQYQLAINKLDK